MSKANRILKNSTIAIMKNLTLYFISATVFFICSDSLAVVRGWIYYILVISGAIVNNYILVRYNPEVLSSRGGKGSNTKSWDKNILGLYFFLHVIIMPGISGFDVVRYKWSKISVSYIFLGVLIYVVSLVISTWAMGINKHFEGTARIQTERNHMVINEGPYKYIRHPGYLAMVLSSFVQPLIIGSVFSLIPGVIPSLLLVIRTYMEDKMLQQELKGYKKYSEKVNFRLIPKVW